jgi:hypothetical protein
LIQIKVAAEALSKLTGETGKMDRSEGLRYPRPCPVCGTAMVGEKGGPDRAEFVRLACFHCGATIEARTAMRGDDPNDPPKP